MKGIKIRLMLCLWLTGCFGLGALARAQVFSHNIVGYINEVIYAGNNLIANQLASGYGNSLSNLFQFNIPEGAKFTKWDSSLLQYLPLSTYDTSTGWSINYELNYGEGGLFQSPAAFTNLLVGNVWPDWNGQYPFNTPLVSSNGQFLLSCVIPYGPATFFDVVGRNPLDGESVGTLNALSQIETLTTFDGGVWNNGVPLLDIGQAAFFNLGPSAPSPVPEPAAGGLLGAGLLVLLRKLRR